MPSKRPRSGGNAKSGARGSASAKRARPSAAAAAAAAAPPPPIRHYHTPRDLQGGSSRAAAGAAAGHGSGGSIVDGMRYVHAHGVRDDSLLNGCQEGLVGRAPDGHILATEAVAFAQLLLRVTNAKRVLQSDKRSGYGSLGLARALPKAADTLLTIVDARHPAMDASQASKYRNPHHDLGPREISDRSRVRTGCCCV